VIRKPKTHTHRGATRVVALVSLVALGAAACSDDANDAAAPTTAATGDTAAPGDTSVTETTVAGATTTAEAPVGDIVATALTNQVFTQLAGMVVDAGLVQTLRGADPGFTVFAPTDAAMAKIPIPMLHMVQDLDGNGDGTPDLLATVLTHHVLPGQIGPDDLVPGDYTSVAGTTLTVTQVGDQKYVNGAPIGAPVHASNGWVYVMGDVLVPPVADIADTAITFDCCFATLVDLVVQADLVETLKSEGPFTVFAPMDSAFAAVPEATLNALVGQYGLENILLYHVVPGKLNLDQLTDGQVLETAAGLELTVSIDEKGTVSINGVPVAVGNVQATNGVIHVMGGVLVPPEA